MRHAELAGQGSGVRPDQPFGLGVSLAVDNEARAEFIGSALDPLRRASVAVNSVSNLVRQCRECLRQADPNGKVHLLGGGWSITSSPTPPISLSIFIDCPWDQTNMKHKLVVELLDADGRPVSFQQGPLGNAEPAFRLEGEFEVGRPPGVPAGTPLREVNAVNIAPGLPLEHGQKYEFRLTINGEAVDSWLSTFYVRPPQLQTPDAAPA